MLLRQVSGYSGRIEEKRSGQEEVTRCVQDTVVVQQELQLLVTLFGHK